MMVGEHGSVFLSFYKKKVLPLKNSISGICCAMYFIIQLLWRKWLVKQQVKTEDAI